MGGAPPLPLWLRYCLLRFQFKFASTWVSRLDQSIMMYCPALGGTSLSPTQPWVGLSNGPKVIIFSSRWLILLTKLMNLIAHQQDGESSYTTNKTCLISFKMKGVSVDEKLTITSNMIHAHHQQYVNSMYL